MLGPNDVMLVTQKGDVQQGESKVPAVLHSEAYPHRYGIVIHFYKKCGSYPFHSDRICVLSPSN